MTRSRKLTLAGVGVGCLVLFGGCGALIGATSDAQSAPAVTRTVAAAPLPTVTQTAPGSEPVVMTAPPETSTAPAPPPVTVPAPTVYVDAPPAPAPAPPAAGSGSSGSGGSSGGGAAYYANCTEARAAGAAPMYRGEPGYRSGLDRDGDGIACDKTR